MATNTNKPVRRKRLPYWSLCYFNSDKTTVIIQTKLFMDQNVSVGDVVACKVDSGVDHAKIIFMSGK